MLSPLATGLTKAFLELSLYGLYVVLFTAVIYLFRHGFIASKNRPVLLELTLVVQFIIITATYFCFMKTGGGAAAKACYLNSAAPAAVANIALFVVAGLITDLLVIHRLYVIWTHRRKVVIFPLVLIVPQADGTVSGAGLVSTFATSGLKEGPATALSLSNVWVTTNLVASLVAGSPRRRCWRASGPSCLGSPPC
ncbi:hypothetical protein B0H10DRAFT_2016068 [Mycena sp. CBHHK59/15]|nr:hypothetical protein B0H10DRAFT_2016068 [Mycena sp. CBHHK59/15]